MRLATPPVSFGLVAHSIVAQVVPEFVRNITSGQFASSAFVDPTDPTYLYTAQPYQPTTVQLGWLH